MRSRSVFRAGVEESGIEEIVGCYLIGMNILGSILFAINTYLYTYTKSGQIDAALTIASLAGEPLEL